MKQEEGGREKGKDQSKEYQESRGGDCIARGGVNVCYSFSSSSDWASLVAQLVKNPPAMRDTWVQSLASEFSPGEGKGYPLQYSGLENSMDCIIHGVAELDTSERPSLSLSDECTLRTTEVHHPIFCPLFRNMKCTHLFDWRLFLIYKERKVRRTEACRIGKYSRRDLLVYY